MAPVANTSKHVVHVDYIHTYSKTDVLVCDTFSCLASQTTLDIANNEHHYNMKNNFSLPTRLKRFTL